MTLCWGQSMRILLRSSCLLQLRTPRASTPQHGACEQLAELYGLQAFISAASAGAQQLSPLWNAARKREERCAFIRVPSLVPGCVECRLVSVAPAAQAVGAAPIADHACAASAAAGLAFAPGPVEAARLEQVPAATAAEQVPATAAAEQVPATAAAEQVPAMAAAEQVLAPGPAEADRLAEAALAEVAAKRRSRRRPQSWSAAPGLRAQR